MSANGTPDLVQPHFLLSTHSLKKKKADTNDFDSDDACKDFAKSLLNEFTFLFGSVKETKKKVGHSD